jgi:hypothetical protein
MSDEQIKQRIQYLVEHGGLYDDPLEDVRRTVRWAFILAGLAAAISLVELMVAVLR